MQQHYNILKLLKYIMDLQNATIKLIIVPYITIKTFICSECSMPYLGSLRGFERGSSIKFNSE